MNICNEKTAWNILSILQKILLKNTLKIYTNSWYIFIKLFYMFLFQNVLQVPSFQTTPYSLKQQSIYLTERLKSKCSAHLLFRDVPVPLSLHWNLAQYISTLQTIPQETTPTKYVP